MTSETQIEIYSFEQAFSTQRTQHTTMNINEPNQEARDLPRASQAPLTTPLASEEELRSLAEDIVRYCPSLTHLLLALGTKGSQSNPLHGLN